jgi:hypothetical protein
LPLNESNILPAYRSGGTRRSKKFRFGVEPVVGFEPTTDGLQNS